MAIRLPIAIQYRELLLDGSGSHPVLTPHDPTTFFPFHAPLSLLTSSNCHADPVSNPQDIPRDGIHCDKCVSPFTTPHHSAFFV